MAGTEASMKRKPIYDDEKTRAKLWGYHKRRRDMLKVVEDIDECRKVESNWVMCRVKHVEWDRSLVLNWEHVGLVHIRRVAQSLDQFEQPLIERKRNLAEAKLNLSSPWTLTAALVLCSVRTTLTSSHKEGENGEADAGFFPTKSNLGAHKNFYKFVCSGFDTFSNGKQRLFCANIDAAHWELGEQKFRSTSTQLAYSRAACSRVIGLTDPMGNKLEADDLEFFKFHCLASQFVAWSNQRSYLYCPISGLRFVLVKIIIWFSKQDHIVSAEACEDGDYNTAREKGQMMLAAAVDAFFIRIYIEGQVQVDEGERLVSAIFVVSKLLTEASEDFDAPLIIHRTIKILFLVYGFRQVEYIYRIEGLIRTNGLLGKSISVQLLLPLIPIKRVSLTKRTA